MPCRFDEATDASSLKVVAAYQETVGLPGWQGPTGNWELGTVHFTEYWELFT